MQIQGNRRGRRLPFLTKLLAAHIAKFKIPNPSTPERLLVRGRSLHPDVKNHGNYDISTSIN
jgi:hypothetical protein